MDWEPVPVEELLAQYEKRYSDHIFYGGWTFAIGSALTAVGYVLARGVHDGRWILFYGATLGGGASLVYGLFGRRSVRREMRRLREERRRALPPGPEVR